MKTPLSVRLGRLTAITALIATGTACQEKNIYVPAPTPVVEVARPDTEEVADRLELTGTTRAVASVDLRARVSGYLESIHFTDGATVEKGDTLFTIDQEPFNIKVEVATAELRKAQADLQLAESELSRAEALMQRSASTVAELDIKASQRNSAAAALASAEAALRDAQLQLAYSVIRAPISGRIGRHLIDVGNLVMPEQTLLANIEAYDPIHVYFTMSEDDLLRITRPPDGSDTRAASQPDLDVRMGLSDEEAYPHRGDIDFSELGIDPETGTAMYRAVFPNETRRIVPGLFARLQVQIGEPRPRLLVPEHAIGTDQRGEFVLIVATDGTVEQRHVRLGTSLNGRRVIEQGLSGGEWIVVNGLQRARPGTKVEAKRLEEPAAKTAAIPATAAEPAVAGAAQ